MSSKYLSSCHPTALFLSSQCPPPVIPAPPLLVIPVLGSNLLYNDVISARSQMQVENWLE
ncbi:hypothetical protein HET73_07420 [Wolbachia endosymbiont of Atemnus politus]|nr:hypothetical protein [Wolbachia endosymbiont of Atemnus politus]